MGNFLEEQPTKAANTKEIGEGNAITNGPGHALIPLGPHGSAAAQHVLVKDIVTGTPASLAAAKRLEEIAPVVVVARLGEVERQAPVRNRGAPVNDGLLGRCR